MAARPHVIIIGGGFGGLSAARTLAHEPVRVTLVDRRNHHVFQPLLYQVATAGLSPGDIASPIRWILRRQKNVTVLLGDVVDINASRKQLTLRDGSTMRFDSLIIASGASHAYFGHDEWQDVAPGLKTLEDGLNIRRRVLLAFERAEREPRPEERQWLLTFIVVGGGPTGVELAGALIELARNMRRDFRTVDPREARVILLEAGPDVLPTFVPRLRDSAGRALQRLGVQVRTGALVTGIDLRGVAIGNERIDGATVLWAAGVAASPLGRTLGVPVDRAGRVPVEPDLSIPGHPDIFVIGDLAIFTHTPDGKPLPGVAPVAIQEGAQAARNIVANLAGRPRTGFQYFDWGNLATIGRAAAVADFGRLKFTGYLAWVLWLFIHIMKLTGFRNRVIVFFEWAFAYFTHQRNIRLITNERAEGGA